TRFPHCPQPRLLLLNFCQNPKSERTFLAIFFPSFRLIFGLEKTARIERVMNLCSSPHPFTEAGFCFSCFCERMGFYTHPSIFRPTRQVSGHDFSRAVKRNK